MGRTVHENKLFGLRKKTAENIGEEMFKVFFEGEEVKTLTEFAKYYGFSLSGSEDLYRAFVFGKLVGMNKQRDQSPMAKMLQLQRMMWC